MFYRHGDVILKKVKNVPTKATAVKNDKRVLAYGEVTGHSHRFVESPDPMPFFKFDDKTYCQVTGSNAMLIHEEHNALVIPEGVYEIVIQREYTPEGWKKVVD
jgi:hypothetical protein